MESYEYCVKNCKIGRGIKLLGLKLSKESNYKMLETRKKWERLCKEAIILRKKGMSYYKISKKLNCGSSSLYKYFKKWVHIQRT
ncbi:hypothetical protein DN395_14305 [Bacillus sp. AR18-7]|nr:hypothetical protein DN395_14305 [Bacillus sp. AR18-7]